MIQEPEVEGSPSILGGGRKRAFCIRTTEVNGPIGYRREKISPPMIDISSLLMGTGT
jgi:hypothetical protein